MKELKELSNQELLEKKQKLKTNNITNAFIIGVLIGITIYSIVNHRNILSFVTIPTIIVTIIVARNLKNQNNALKEEIKSRNLK